MGPARQPHALTGGIHPSGLKRARARTDPPSAEGVFRLYAFDMAAAWAGFPPLGLLLPWPLWPSGTAPFFFFFFYLLSKNSTGQNINPNALIPISKFLEYCNLFNGATFIQIQPPFILCKYLNVVFSI